MRKNVLSKNFCLQGNGLIRRFNYPQSISSKATKKNKNRLAKGQIALNEEIHHDKSSKRRLPCPELRSKI